ncbi:MAG: XdhC family protein [Anaerolineales bacterium]|nr:XdhC family protein [Anaerolineales bacterium]
MKALVNKVESWAKEHKAMALATVVQTWGSSPRGLGAKMVVNENGGMVGSVSGGCVEGAVVAAGMEIIQSGRSRLLHFGVADAAAWDVGLACGGEIEVYVQPLDAVRFTAWKAAWEEGASIHRGVVLQGPAGWKDQEIGFGKEGEKIRGEANDPKKFLVSRLGTVQQSGIPFRETVPGPEGSELDIFWDVLSPDPTLVIVGGVHIAVALVKIANTLGYETILIDPRRQFGNRERFPDADQVINTWPREAFSEVALGSSTAVAILTHDPKIDDPALEVVLRSPVFYVGALGSKSTQLGRKERLLAAGLSETQVQKIKGPIGLDLGGRSPEEIGLAIMAEIVMTKNRHHRK